MSKAGKGAGGRKGGEDGGASAAAGDGGAAGGAEEHAKAEGSAGQGDGYEEGEGEGEYDDADQPPPLKPLHMAFWTVVVGTALVAIGATVTELWPTHMAPQSIMSRAHDVFQADPDVSTEET